MSKMEVIQQQSGKPGLNTPILAKFPPLLGNRNFLLLWAGYVVSALGDRIHFVVMLTLLGNLLARKLNHPGYVAGTLENSRLTIAMMLPFLLLGPFSGILADRLPRRTLMVVSDLVRVVIVLVARFYFLENQAGDPTTLVYLLLASEFVLGIFSTTFSPARTALMPELVHPTQLLQANSLTTAAGTIASLIGFVIGGALIAWHLSYAMFVDAGTFLGSATCILLMRVPKNVGQAASSGKGSNPLRDLADGVRYMLKHKHVLQVIGLMLLFWACGGLMLNGLTGIVTHEFGLNISNYSYFMGVVGLGMIVGAGMVSVAREGIPKEMGIAWAMVLVGVFLLGFSLMRQWYTALPFLVIAAMFGAVLLVSLETLLQRIVPNFIRGRVMGVKDVISTIGILGVALPLAIDENIDQGIRVVIIALSAVVILVGLILVITYYRNQYLSLPVSIIIRIGSAYLAFWKRFKRGNANRIPTTGAVIFVSNHSTAFDPIILQAVSKRRLIQFMMAKEYYLMKPFNYLYRWLGVIPVNRTGNDTASIRAALRVLHDGGCIGMFPEGKISVDGRMDKGRPGVAMLAMMSGATVVPAYIQGGNVYSGMIMDFVKPGLVTLYFGRPIRFDDLKGKHKDEAAREVATQRIMDGITSLRDRYETNPERRKFTYEAAPPAATSGPAPAAS
jgi:1-acyl-sn-glycerol-3-phosphate acyltransferase